WPAVRAVAERRIRGPRPELARRLEALRKSEGFLRWIDVWPALAAIFCWKGGSAPFYLRRFPEHFGATRVYDLGFAATEGFFSAPLSPEGDDGVLVVDGHFLEFIPEARYGEPGAPALDASELEVGGRYAIVFTTSGGLYRYDIGDVVEVTRLYRRTPMVRFLHKTCGMVSITGEKMGESHAVRAMDRALTGLPLRLAGFTCALDLSGAEPRYQVLVETEAGAEAPDGLLADLLVAMDRELGEANIEYRAKRDSLRLAPPKLVVLAPGSYERFRKARLGEGAHDAHVKTPHLSRDPDFARRFDVLREVSWPG
ncbi:MAG: GH3 auxin-responsive promoter family protein, partial [Candidatus Methylomirabilis sp.]|nr:GH3 auxin-responsive promoter family protein [Deltaproteobacteria bacterium]